MKNSSSSPIAIWKIQIPKEFETFLLRRRRINPAAGWVGVAARAPGSRDPGTHAADPAPGRAKNMGGCDVSAGGRPFLRYNRTEGGRAGDGTGQADEPHAGRAGGQGQAHEAGRVPRQDGPRGAPGRGCRPWWGRRGRARQAALARRDAARDAPCAVLARPAGRRLRGACHDSLSVRDFMGCRYRVPDACGPRGLPSPPGAPGPPEDASGSRDCLEPKRDRKVEW